MALPSEWELPHDAPTAPIYPIHELTLIHTRDPNDGTWRQCVACRGHPKGPDANTTTPAHHEAPTASHDESREETHGQ